MHTNNGTEDKVIVKDILCIPRVLSNIKGKYIIDTFNKLNIFKIKKVDIVEMLAFNRAFVHIDKWMDNAKAHYAKARLEEGNDIKVIYSEPWFWKLKYYKKNRVSERNTGMPPVHRKSFVSHQSHNYTNTNKAPNTNKASNSNTPIRFHNRGRYNHYVKKVYPIEENSDDDDDDDVKNEESIAMRANYLLASNNPSKPSKPTEEKEPRTLSIINPDKLESNTIYWEDIIGSNTEDEETKIKTKKHANKESNKDDKDAKNTPLEIRIDVNDVFDEILYNKK